MGFLVRHAAAGESVMKRISAATRLLASGGATVEQVQPPTARSPGRLATRLRLGQQVAEALAYAFARWDGKRLPAGVAKRDIPLPARLLHLVDVVVAHHCLGGWSERLPSLVLARATSNKQIAIGLGMAPETGAATSSTSTPRSAYRPAPPPPCSPSSVAWPPIANRWTSDERIARRLRR